MLPYRTGTVRVSSPFGWRNISGEAQWHKGIDLVGTDKQICAVVGGTVGNSLIVTDTSNRTWEWGNYIRIDGDDGYQYFYCHLSRRMVGKGDRVEVGDVIGLEGSTGKSTGSHLHFEMRKSGTSYPPSDVLGISNAVGSYAVTGVDKYASTANTDDYTVGELRILRAKKPRLVYLDAAKNKMVGKNCCNADFFGNYKRGATTYTLPRGNLMCYMGDYAMPEDVKQDLERYVYGNVLRYDCADNAADSGFRDKKPSTLVILQSGEAHIEDIAEIPRDAVYAVSGVPCVRNGDDVDWYNYVTKQGWGADTVRNAYHNWLGVKNGEVYVITGKSSAGSNNLIYGMWFWDRIRGEGFDDIIKLDGGGSYYCRVNGKILAGSTGTRRINAYFVWE